MTASDRQHGRMGPHRRTWLCLALALLGAFLFTALLLREDRDLVLLLGTGAGAVLFGTEAGRRLRRR